MTTTAEGAFTEELVEVADVRIQFRRGGTGESLLVLHGELGVPGWLRAYALLAEHFTVYVPSLPGFGQSAPPDWIVTVRDLAAWVTWFVRDLQLPQPLHVIGCSMGGWIAAEIATTNASIFKKMVLVGAAGLKPEVGEVWDYFVHSAREACAQAFYGPAQSPEYAQYYGKAWTAEDEALHYCTEAGFDGVMINEHHNNPLCMMPSVNVIGSILARTTRKGRIVFLGNVLPIHDNPLRVAEEIAMIDILSGGRVVCGFVRGIGQESIATNTNPVYNRERFDEAHNLIVKAWTTPGPFRWEGRHYDYRVVNPWVKPLQKPHPPIWIPGVASPESVRWAAEHRYPYVALAPPLDLIEEIYDLYDEVATAQGFTPTAEHRGYAIRVSVADSDEKAYEEGRSFYWQLGTSFGVAPRH